MDKKIFIILFFFTLAAAAAADENLESTEEALFNKLSITVNPFTPKLPKPLKKDSQKLQGVNDPKDNPPEIKNAPAILTGLTPPMSRQTKESLLSQVNVMGIVWDTNRPQAIINGQVVNIGDQIKTGDDASALKIVDIRKDGIDVKYNEELITINP